MSGIEFFHYLIFALMRRELFNTSDGSHTVVIPQLQVTYHSIHGAVQESRHVFIEAGLEYMLSKFQDAQSGCIRLFEMGFGTGLNALLSLEKAKEAKRCLYYMAAELYPLSAEETASLNYVSFLHDETLRQAFPDMHASEWNQDVIITSGFTLHKASQPLTDVKASQPFHLIYFDAFAPDVQPELWTQPVFQQMYEMLYTGGALVTYCSKGSVHRAMQATGFAVEKLKGPPGKREMIRAVKK